MSNLRCNNYPDIFENLQCGEGVRVAERQILLQGEINCCIVTEIFLPRSEDKMKTF